MGGGAVEKEILAGGEGGWSFFRGLQNWWRRSWFPFKPTPKKIPFKHAHGFAESFNWFATHISRDTQLARPLLSAARTGPRVHPVLTPTASNLLKRSRLALDQRKPHGQLLTECGRHYLAMGQKPQ